MVSTSSAENIAHGRDVQTEVPGNLALPIPVFLDSLCYLLVSLFSVLEYTLIEDFIKQRTVCVPLASWYLGHMFVFLQVIDEAVYEFVFAQYDLPLNLLPDRFSPDSPVNELAVFLFCLASFTAELTENPIRGEAGVGFRFACGCAVAAPFPLLGTFYHPCPKGI